MNNRKWVFLCACAVVGLNAAQIRANNVTITLVPKAGDLPPTGSGVVTVEVFATAGAAAQSFNRYQLNWPCSAAGQPGSTGTVGAGVPEPVTGGSPNAVVAINGNGSENGIPSLFGPTGIYAVNQEICQVFGTPTLGVPYVDLPAGATRYLGQIEYTVSECATGDFVLELEGFTDPKSPSPVDPTRFRDADLNLIPWTYGGDVKLTIPVGTCCDGGKCKVDGVNRYCCENGLTGFPNAQRWREGEVCGSMTDCSCLQHSHCDNGQYCDGYEYCNLVLGLCQDGADPLCPDGQCTTGYCDATLPGDPRSDTGQPQTGACAGANNLSITLVPKAGDLPATGASVITVEVFATAGAAAQSFNRYQLNWPCSAAGQPGSTGTVGAGVPEPVTGGSPNAVVAINGSGSENGIPSLFGSTGIYAVNQEICQVFGTPTLGVPYVDLPAGATRYLGEIEYAVSDCATGAFTLALEGFNDPKAPSPVDPTRFQDADLNLIPWIYCGDASVTIPVGTCCDGSTCKVDGVNQYCCENGLTGFPNAQRWFEGDACGTMTECGCTQDAHCDNGQYCDGYEFCNLALSLCEDAPDPDCPNGPDTQCTNGYCNPTLPGDPRPNTGQSQAGACEVLNKPDGQFCDDGVECTQLETCLLGNCVSGTCPEFTGGCGPENNLWSCGNNWNLSGDFPNNSESESFSVTIPSGTELHLDVDVSIDDLHISGTTQRVTGGAVLHVTHTGAEGDLTLVRPGGLLLEGTLIAGAGRVIDVSTGRILVRGSGRYTGPSVQPARLSHTIPTSFSPRGNESSEQGAPGRVDSSAFTPAVRPSALRALSIRGEEGHPPRAQRGVDPNSSVLQGAVALAVPVCGNGICDEGETGCSCPQDQSVCGACIGGADTVIESCDPCPPGMCPPDECGIFLGDGMDLQTGNLTLNGIMPNGQPAAACDVAGVRGLIVPPPKFQARVDANVSVSEDITLQGSVVVHHSSSNSLELGGDFINHASQPQCFDWTGGIAITGEVTHTFEVAGRDLGAVPEGFHTGTDSNFSMGTLEIGTGVSARFVNAFANTVAAGPCQEALYVRNLILRAGSTITLEGVAIYYDTLINEGAIITPFGCDIPEAASCALYPDCSDENICTDDRCDAEHCTHTPLAELIYGDLYRETVDFPPGPADVDDLLCIVAAFGGIFSETCPMERTDLFPCDADVPAELVCTTDSYCQAILSVPCIRGRCLVVDVDDLTAVVQSFAGQFSCPHPCEP
jgi:hypothetical protein